MAHPTKLIIELINFKNKDTFCLTFDLLIENNITKRWVKKVKAAQRLGYKIDDPERFYGFNNPEDEYQKSVNLVNKNIDVINSFDPIIDRHLSSIHDQNTLNYLHKIFEDYHGFLDKQTHHYWNKAPNNVRLALANLNINVHRCEAIGRKLTKKFVVTWFGLPKKHKYKIEDYKLFTRELKFGSVYINYVEIGKTLEDYYYDQELDNFSHAGIDAFKPFEYFSADFVVRFENTSKEKANEIKQNVQNYFIKHRDFFEAQGYTLLDTRLNVGYIPVATLNTTLSEEEISNKIKSHQYVNRVYFI